MMWWFSMWEENFEIVQGKVFHTRCRKFRTWLQVHTLLLIFLLLSKMNTICFFIGMYIIHLCKESELSVFFWSKWVACAQRQRQRTDDIICLWLKSTLRNKRNAKHSLSLNEIFPLVYLNGVAVITAIYMQGLQTYEL